MMLKIEKKNSWVYFTRIFDSTTGAVDKTLKKQNSWPLGSLPVAQSQLYKSKVESANNHPEIDNANFRCALWTYEQQLVLQMRAHCGISDIVLLHVKTYLCRAFQDRRI